MGEVGGGGGGEEGRGEWGGGGEESKYKQPGQPLGNSSKRGRTNKPLLFANAVALLSRSQTPEAGG